MAINRDPTGILIRGFDLTGCLDFGIIRNSTNRKIREKRNIIPQKRSEKFDPAARKIPRMKLKLSHRRGMD
jgi:hypothetical protein